MTPKETLNLLQELKDSAAYGLILKEVGERQEREKELCVDFRTLKNEGPIAIAYKQGVIAGYSELLDVIEELENDCKEEVRLETRNEELRRGDFD